MARRWSSVSSRPSVLRNTTDPVPLAASGNSSCKRSVTWAVGVPGMVIEEVRAPPKARNPPTARASAASQATMATQGRRDEANPRR